MKPGKQKSGDTPSKKSAKEPRRETVKVNLSLGVEQYRRLFITSVMSRKTASRIMDELIESGLKTWALPADLSHRGQSPVSVNSAGPVEPAAEIAA